MNRPRASDALAPGAHGRISEEEWYACLQAAEPLHQWGAAFLYDEARTGDGELVRVYLRDVSGAGRHSCVRLDAARSQAARAGVERIEAASRRAADLITAGQSRPAQSVADLEAQAAASQALVDEAERLYRALLGG